MLSNPLIAHGAKFVNVSRTFGEDDHHQRDHASDQRHRRSYPEHSALSVKHDPVRVPAASRYLLGMRVDSEVRLRGMRMMTGREACVLSVQRDAQKLFIHEHVEDHLANRSLDAA